MHKNNFVIKNEHRSKHNADFKAIHVDPDGALWTKLSGIMWSLSILKDNVDDERNVNWKDLHIFGKYELNVP